MARSFPETREGTEAQRRSDSEPAEKSRENLRVRETVSDPVRYYRARRGRLSYRVHSHVLLRRVKWSRAKRFPKLLEIVFSDRDQCEEHDGW